jgi:hypothetical protein
VEDVLEVWVKVLRGVVRLWVQEKVKEIDEVLQERLRETWVWGRLRVKVTLQIEVGLVEV